MCVGAATLVLGASLETPAFAQSEADKLFDEGAALMKAGHVAEACPKLEQSNKLDPEIGGMLWLADCYERNGQTASAYRTYKDAQKMAIERKDKHQRDKVAQKHIATLEPKLSKLTVLVPADKPAGLEVTRDGQKLEASDLGLAAPVDPGAHTIVATAPHFQRWEKKVAVGTDGSAETVTVGPLEPEVAAAPSEPVPRDTGPDPAFAYHVGGIVVGAAGLVGIGLGSVFGLVAAGKLSDSNANNHCDAADTCDAVGLQLRADAKAAALVSTIAFIAGGVAVAAGIAIYFLAPKKKRHEMTYFSPMIGNGTYGAAIGGSF